MNPSSFRPPGHVELVAGASDINSFAREIAQGRLGTVVGQEVHEHDTLEWNHKKMWLAVVGRAAKDAAGETEDLEYADTEDDVAVKNPSALADRYDAKFDALEWFGERTGDYLLVMEFVGLGPSAGEIARMPPETIVANLTAFEKREELERKGKRK